MQTRRLMVCGLVMILVLWSGLGWAQQPRHGGTLRIALSGDLTFLNANQGPAPGYETFWIWNNIFNSLLSMTPPPELKIVPALATLCDVLDEGKAYVFKEWVPGKHIILEKNPTYFKPDLPYLDTVEFRVMKGPLTASAALRAGEVDLIARVPIQQALVLEKMPGITVLTGPAMAPTVALLNMRVKPFDDARARRAVGGYGLDRAEIAKVAFHGRSKPLVSVLAQGVPDAIDLNEMYPYNPEEAKRLLKELGYDAQHPLQFTILVSNHDSTLADIAALVKTQLAKIGVEAKINLMDLTAVIDRFVVKHDFDMTINSFADLLDINMRSVSFFKGAQADYLGMDDPKLEEMVRQWRRSLEPSKRLAISADIQRLLAEQMYWVNIAGYPFFRAHTAKVQGFPFYGQAYLFLESTWLNK